MVRLGLRAVLTGVGALILCGVVRAESVRVSAKVPTMVAAYLDPRPVVFFPGDLSPTILTTPTVPLKDMDPRVSLLLANGERYVIPEFMVNPGADGAGQARDAWERLRGVLSGAGFRGVVPELRLSVAVTAHLLKDETSYEQFAARLADVTRIPGYPLLTVEGSDDALAVAAGLALSNTFPGMLVGHKVDVVGSLEHLGPFHFVVVDFEALGGIYREQSGFAAVRKVIGEKPIFAEVRLNQAEKGFFYLAAGAAGVMPKGRSDGLAGADVGDSTAVLTLSMAVKQQPGAQFEFEYAPTPDNTAAAMRTANGTSYLLLSGQSRSPRPFQPATVEKHVLPFWYQATRNQLIVRPVDAVASQNARALQPPTDEPWLYGRVSVDDAEAQATTVTLGRDLVGVEW